MAIPNIENKDKNFNGGNQFAFVVSQSMQSRFQHKKPNNFDLNSSKKKKVLEHGCRFNSLYISKGTNL